MTLQERIDKIIELKGNDGAVEERRSLVKGLTAEELCAFINGAVQGSPAIKAAAYQSYENMCNI